MSPVAGTVVELHPKRVRLRLRLRPRQPQFHSAPSGRNQPDRRATAWKEPADQPEDSLRKAESLLNAKKSLLGIQETRKGKEGRIATTKCTKDTKKREDKAGRKKD